jgi:hypothetical protein
VAQGNDGAAGGESTSDIQEDGDNTQEGEELPDDSATC